MNDEAMRLFGITLEVGEEYRMGWYEHTFLFADPIAGIERLETGHGTAAFTPSLRCVVITDGFQVVILDRLKNHGVRLAIPYEHWFEATVEGGKVVIKCYEAHGGKKLTGMFEVEAEVDDNRALVPPGWPWESTLLPA